MIDSGEARRISETIRWLRFAATAWVVGALAVITIALALVVVISERWRLPFRVLAGCLIVGTVHGLVVHQSIRALRAVSRQLRYLRRRRDFDCECDCPNAEFHQQWAARTWMERQMEQRRTEIDSTIEELRSLLRELTP